MQEKIIILHEYGANSHYRALKYLLDNNMTIEYYEFSITRQLVKSIVRMDSKLFKKQISNIKNLINLLFSKNKKIVLGIAPYDYRLYILEYILRNHKVYYHTSRPYWDNNAPFPHKLFYSKKLLEVWSKFLVKNSRHIFAVSECSKNSLIQHKHVIPSKISVVYHSFDSNIYYPEQCNKKKKTIDFLYVGRLSEAKGIKKILDFFNTNYQNITLSIVGNGDLQSEVERMALASKHITYYGYIDSQIELANIYRKSDYLLLPSVKQAVWEELFGMVMIEAMACGVVPVASNHIGPTEVISSNENGILMDEKDFKLDLLKLITKHDEKKYSNLRDGAIKRSNDFSIQRVSRRWLPILEHKKEQKS